MSRRIRTVSLQSAGGVQVPPDDFGDRIVKLIPGDVLAAWIAIVGGMKTAAYGNLNGTAFWVVFGVICVACALWTFRKASLPNQPAVIQTVVSTIAFIVWAYATTGEQFPSISGHGLYTPLCGTIALSVFTLFSGAVTKP